uniref:DNA_MISMATCH_REPAIR_2 domain-containing protein n=1 Tax=Caenorhabditis japonica TaxID=281687 RepID=A0A8R1IAZ3_CAEJA
MATRWRYYNSKRGGNGFRGRGRGRGRGTSLTAIQLPRDDMFNNEHGKDYYRDKPMDPKDYKDEIVLSLSFGQNMLGAAAYHQSSQMVNIMNDISEDHEFKYLEKLIEEMEPTMILTNKSQDLDFIKWLSARYDAGIGFDKTNGSEDTTDRTDESIPTWNASLAYSLGETTVQVEDEENEAFDGSIAKLYKLPNNFFKMPRALERLKKMMETDGVVVSDEDRHTIVTMRFDIEAVHMMRSLGALLHFLDETRLGVEREPLTVSSPIKSIKTITLANLVDIDFNTIRALDILPNETGGKMTGGMGKSLFSLADRCRSTVGKKYLRKWFRNPTTDRNELISRQKCVHFFKQDWNAEVTVKIAQILGKVKPQNNIFLRFQNGSAQLIHWEGFVSTVNALVEMANIIKLTSLAAELYIENSLVKEVSEIAVITGSVINFAESKIQGRVTVMPGVDAELDKTRDTYENMPMVLTAIAKQEAARLEIYEVSQVSCLYVPLVGFILSLPRDFPADKYPDMSLVYATSDELRVRNTTTERLENEFGDILMKMIDNQTAIILSLKTKVMMRKGSINKLLALAARIDALVALGLTAAENGWNCPSLVDEPVIEAAELFHPISALLVKKQAIPNPVCSGRNGIKVSVITGPNACGKSVYMKSIGIMAFLAHIGSFVPARHAKVGIVDRIVTRMFTVDSVLDGISTFAKDVEQVALALRKATCRSLVIIDEFGKGTMTEVGLSLLSSCLNHWMRKGIQGCPHVFLASHFHALPRYMLLETNLATFLTFTVIREAGGKIKYLFQLVPGLVDCSFAMAVAKEQGISTSVIGRACRIYKALKSGSLLKEVRAEVTNDNEEQQISDMDIVLSDQDGFLDAIESFITRDTATALCASDQPEKLNSPERMGPVDKEAEQEKEQRRTSSLSKSSKRQRSNSISTILSSKSVASDQLSLFDALLPRKKPKCDNDKSRIHEEERQTIQSTSSISRSPELFVSDEEEEEEYEHDEVTSNKQVPLLQRLSSEEENTTFTGNSVTTGAVNEIEKGSEQQADHISMIRQDYGYPMETPKQTSRNSIFSAFTGPQAISAQKEKETSSHFKTPISTQRTQNSRSAHVSSKNSNSSANLKNDSRSSHGSRELDPDIMERSSSRRGMRSEDNQFEKDLESCATLPIGTQFSFLNSQNSTIIDPSEIQDFMFPTEESESSSSSDKKTMKSQSMTPIPNKSVFATPVSNRKNQDKQRSFLVQRPLASRQTISPSSMILGELTRGCDTPLQTPLPRGDRIVGDEFTFNTAVLDNGLHTKNTPTSSQYVEFLKSDDEDEAFLRSFFESEKSLKIDTSPDKTVNSKSSRK